MSLRLKKWPEKFFFHFRSSKVHKHSSSYVDPNSLLSRPAAQTMFLSFFFRRRPRGPAQCKQKFSHNMLCLQTVGYRRCEVGKNWSCSPLFGKQICYFRAKCVLDDQSSVLEQYQHIILSKATFTKAVITAKTIFKEQCDSRWRQDYKWDKLPDGKLGRSSPKPRKCLCLPEGWRMQDLCSYWRKFENVGFLLNDLLLLWTKILYSIVLMALERNWKISRRRFGHSDCGGGGGGGG